MPEVGDKENIVFFDTLAAKNNTTKPQKHEVAQGVKILVFLGVLEPWWAKVQQIPHED